MRKPVYEFEAFNSAGKILRRSAEACNNVSAHDRVFDLLRSTPDAVAVFGFEKNGRQVHAAYRH